VEISGGSAMLQIDLINEMAGQILPHRFTHT